VATIEIPGYKIIKKLGVGGQATVYLAIQQGFDRKVALKVMSPALAADPSFGKRFIREAKIVAKLSHNNIVTVYDVGQSGNYYYLAMEYLPSRDIKAKITKGMTTRDCLIIIAKVARALHFAHDKGYIHRDVKSENIIFNQDNEPVLTDFGIAKASNSSTQMTQTGKLIGTPEYMSPEQCRGQKIDGRSDIYSLGIILYEMLTGGVPFTGEDSVAICIMHVTAPIPKLPPRLKHLQWLIDKLLDKDPDKRIQSGADLTRALTEFIKSGNSSTALKQLTNPARSGKKSDSKTTVRPSSEFFDEFAQTEKDSSKGKSGGFLKILLLASLAGAGYYYQDKWFPQTNQWFQDNVMVHVQEFLDADTGKSDISSDTLLAGNQNQQNETQAGPPTVEELIQQVNEISSVDVLNYENAQKAFKLIEAIKLIQPENIQLDALKQSLINNSLAKISELATAEDFEIADQWYEMIAIESPNHPFLTVTRENIDKLYTAHQEKIKAEQDRLQQITDWLAIAEQLVEQKNFIKPDNENALYYFNQVLSLDVNNIQAQAGLVVVSDNLAISIEQLIKDKQIPEAKSQLDLYQSLPKSEDKYEILLADYQKTEVIYNKEQDEIKRLAAIEEAKRKKEAEREARLSDPLVQLQLQSFLTSAKELEQQKLLVEPDNNNALQKYQSVLQIDDRHQEAKDGIKRIEQTIISEIQEAINQNDKTNAEKWLLQLIKYDPLHTSIGVFQQKIQFISVAPQQGDNTNL